MNKLIGGLLIISLLGRPAILRVDYIAYEFYKSNNIIINFLRKNNELIEEQENEEEKIEALMQEIDSNKRLINNLVKEKNEIVADLESVMKINAMERKPLSNEFIYEFREFNELYIEERGEIQERIDSIIHTDFNEIQKEMLHNESDYEYIVAEFEQIAENQNSIIDFLLSIVNKGKNTLALC